MAQNGRVKWSNYMVIQAVLCKLGNERMQTSSKDIFQGTRQRGQRSASIYTLIVLWQWQPFSFCDGNSCNWGSVFFIFPFFFWRIPRCIFCEPNQWLSCQPWHCKPIGSVHIHSACNSIHSKDTTRVYSNQLVSLITDRGFIRLSHYESLSVKETAHEAVEMK